jgi:hypothetical protein
VVELETSVKVCSDEHVPDGQQFSPHPGRWPVGHRAFLVVIEFDLQFPAAETETLAIMAPTVAKEIS